MTAPPTQMPLFAFTEAQSHSGAASYLLPTSSASGTAPFWDPMAPSTGTNGLPSPRKSMNSATIESNGSPNGLLFITGTKPADFKSQGNLTKIRKKAMGSYLRKEKQPRGTPKEQKRGREGSTGSRKSVGSEQPDTLSNSEALSIWRGDSRRPGRQRSSSTEDTETHEQNTVRRKTHDSSISSMSLDFTLGNTPMVLPSRTGIKLLYDQFKPGPFKSIGNPLDPFQTMFQTSHPRISVEDLKFYCTRVFGTRAMGMRWITTLIKSSHAFLSTLCIASAHYDAIHERPIESVQTLALRQEVMHLISQSLVNPQSQVDDFNIIALTQLIASEMISGTETSLNYHERGVEAMIKQRGGLNRLGASGAMASTISWISLESAIFREAQPRTMYSEYCLSHCTKHYTAIKTIPESPLYCPRGEYEAVRKSSGCSQRTLDILKDVRMMLDLFLHETKQSRQNALSLKNIHKKLTKQYPSVSELQQTNVLTAADWRYEAIRLTCTITATAIARRVPLSEALTQAAEEQNPVSTSNSNTPSTSDESLMSSMNRRRDSFTASLSARSMNTNPFEFAPLFPGAIASPKSNTPSNENILLANLKLAIQNSDLSDCWVDMAGVLLWVALTVSAASRTSDKVLRKWFRALAVRVSIVLCFEHPEAIHATMLRMSELVEGVGNVVKSAVSDGNDKGATKVGGKKRCL